MGNMMLFDISLIFGYIDGGTGSIIVQAAIATVLGLAATTKIFWFQIKNFFTKSKKETVSKPTDDA